MSKFLLSLIAVMTLKAESIEAEADIPLADAYKKEGVNNNVNVIKIKSLFITPSHK